MSSKQTRIHPRSSLPVAKKRISLKVKSALVPKKSWTCVFTKAMTKRQFVEVCTDIQDTLNIAYETTPETRIRIDPSTYSDGGIDWQSRDGTRKNLRFHNLAWPNEFIHQWIYSDDIVYEKGRQEHFNFKQNNIWKNWTDDDMNVVRSAFEKRGVVFGKPTMFIAWTVK